MPSASLQPMTSDLYLRSKANDAAIIAEALRLVESCGALAALAQAEIDQAEHGKADQRQMQLDLKGH